MPHCVILKKDYAMKKTFLIAALLIGLLLFAGGYADSHYKTAPGHQAPFLSMNDADSMLTLDRMKGDYVLVNFWSSSDATSRQAANLYTAWQRRHPEAKLKMLGINFDDSEGLFHEIVRRDSLVAEEQFYVRGDTARAIFDNYGLSDGFGAVLIGPDGHIIALNPTDAELDMIIPKTAS